MENASSTKNSAEEKSLTSASVEASKTPSLFKKNNSSMFKKKLNKSSAAAARGGSGVGGGMRRKRANNGNSSGSSEDDMEVIKADKRVKKGFNSFSTMGKDAEARAAAREALAKETMSSGSVFESTKAAAPARNAGDATYYNEIDTHADRDARAILEKNVRLNEEGATTDRDGLYHGQAGYKNHIKKDKAQIGGNKHTGTQGPIRAPTFLRATCRFDYQPDICKDYKETGFCGFGDSCKFLHDRADYKSGWAMEQEFEAKEKKRKEREALGDFADEEEKEEYLVESDEDLPFACVICRQGFRDPIVTNCGHYFCEKCAQDHYKTDQRCAACGKQTQGVFNAAKRLTDKMKKKGMVTRKIEAAAEATVAGEDQGAESDYEIREDGVELTGTDIVRRKTGTWATVHE